VLARTRTRALWRGGHRVAQGWLSVGRRPQRQRGGAGRARRSGRDGRTGPQQQPRTARFLGKSAARISAARVTTESRILQPPAPQQPQHQHQRTPTPTRTTTPDHRRRRRRCRSAPVPSVVRAPPAPAQWHSGVTVAAIADRPVPCAQDHHESRARTSTARRAQRFAIGRGTSWFARAAPDISCSVR
jgi:hypothetical protein